MSNYPWALQEMLGIAAPPKKKRRTGKLTDETPATFTASLNWDSGAENCTCNPTLEPGVVTLLGPFKGSSRGGKGSHTQNARAVHAVATAVRKLGLDVPEVEEVLQSVLECREEYEEEEEDGSDGADGAGSEKAKTEALKTKAPPPTELEALEEDDCFFDRTFTIQGQGGKTIGTIDTHSLDDRPYRVWVQIRLEAEEVKGKGSEPKGNSLLESLPPLLERDVVLVTLPHTSVTIDKEFVYLDQSEGYTIEARTGNGPKNNKERHSELGTLFTVRRKDKVVAKALCSYHNGEMNFAGPTLELIEVASQWQGHGVGMELVVQMRCFFEETFNVIDEEDGTMTWSACYVTTGEASRWLQNRGFVDADGMGEELMMPIFY